MDEVRAHPICEFTLLDPMTHYARARPRGYQGDARLIDMIYGHPSVDPLIEHAPSMGQQIFAYTQGSIAADAVRERRRLLAYFIDATVARTGEAEILSVACGHMRELELARRIGSAKRVVGLDQDGETLKEIERCYSHIKNVDIIGENISRVIFRPETYGSFDLIYSAGLYDYLNSKTATLLTKALFSRLKPGGQLVIANFSQEIRDQGYMEALMDWRLIFRGSSDLGGMIDSLPNEEIAHKQVFFGNNEAIIYAVATRT